MFVNGSKKASKLRLFKIASRQKFSVAVRFFARKQSARYKAQLTSANKT